MRSLLVLCAIPMFLLSYANSFFTFALCSFGFGLAGVSFAIGIAYTSVWYPKHWQGRALGIFGAGNAGAALTTLLAPTLSEQTDRQRRQPRGLAPAADDLRRSSARDGDRVLPLRHQQEAGAHNKNLRQLLAPLKSVRVWRFGLYYFLVFGCFVAFSQWLVPYFVNVYYLPLVTAGLFAPCSAFRPGSSAPPADGCRITGGRGG